MLKSIKIRNFQSHKNTVLEFSQGVNVIVGDPQSGKTAILRAFQWLANNRPLGFRFHSHFSSKPTVVEVELQDGTRIERLKSRTKGYYRLVTPQGKKFKWSGMRSGVPEAVTKALSMGDLNVQPQLDQFFLITSSPQEIARTVNRVTRLEKVDEEWLPKLTRRINSTRTEIKLIDADVEDLENQKKKFKDLPDIEKRLRKAEEKAEEAERLQHQIEVLERIQKDRNRILKRMREIDLALDLEPRIIKAEADLKEIHKLEDDILVFKRFAEKERRIINQLERLDEKIYRNEINLKRIVDREKVCPLCLGPLDEERKNALLLVE